MFWDRGENLAFATGFSLLEQSSHSTLALSIQVHTSPNAVLMKPFITSSRLNPHHFSHTLTHTHQASCFFFLSVCASVRTLCRPLRPPTAPDSLPCGCTSSILVSPRFGAALVGISPTSPFQVFFLKQADVKRWVLPFALNPPLYGSAAVSLPTVSTHALVIRSRMIEKTCRTFPSNDHPLVCDP